MVSKLYLICLILSCMNLVFVSLKKSRYTDKYFLTMMIVIPVAILGYWLKSTVHTSEGAMIALCFIYVDSTVLLAVMLFTLLRSINIPQRRWVKLIVYSVTLLHLLSIWVSKGTRLYYDSVLVHETSLGSMTVTTSGPLKMTHYVFLGAIFLAFIVFIIMGWVRNGTYSRKSLLAYSICGILGICIYVFEIVIGISFTTLPVFYVIGTLIIMLNYDNSQKHIIENLIAARQSSDGYRAYVAFDLKRRFLGNNKEALNFSPEVERLVVDEVIPPEQKELGECFNSAIDVFLEDPNESIKVQMGEEIYRVMASYFSVGEGGRPNGYLIEMTDITEQQRQLEIIEKYNETLSSEVELKTEHIVEIQNSVVLGLANMVENRDNNTGGHVKRTSDVIKILVNEIRNQGTYNIDARTAVDIVRAAPMHDLGKISVDSNILCKPGKLTDEEFAIMKSHAPQSGEIVKIILQGVEEQHFVDVCYNVARHHHERWDGRGYPDGLMGEEIPVEARIMAVADVYDALVSKRCYKEPMSFDTAFNIMNDCMGSQFDPVMRPVFIACRQQMEEYYSDNRE